MARRNGSNAKRAMVTTVAPWTSAFAATTTRPMQWYIGATARTVSSGPSPSTASFCASWATAARCVISTPLGNPVVPLEYGSRTTSSGATSTSAGAPPPARSPNPRTASTPAARAASAARSANGGTVTTNRAPESRSWVASSPAVYSGLAVVTAPPVIAAPRTATTNSGTFGL
jgi:hypothetical protein